MPKLDVQFSIIGVDKLVKKLAPKMMIEPLRLFFGKVTMQVVRETKKKAPVLLGRMRASIGGGAYQGGSFPKGSGIEFGKSHIWGAIRPFPMWVRIGVPVDYASVVEFSGRNVRPGGIGQIPFFGPGIELAQKKFSGFINEARRMIESRWGR